MHLHKLPRILTAALLVALTVSAFTLPADAKGKKRKAAVAQSKGKSGKQAKASGSRSSRSQAARRGKRGRHRNASADLADNVPPESAGNHSVVPDRIEVLEYGSTSSADTSRWLNPSSPRNSGADGATEALAPRGKRVNIDSERVIQIQRALATRGFYAGETNGVYDEVTVDAMRRFQISNKIAVTGYPTAHSLKRLGLGHW